MTIGIDARMLGPKQGGIGRYIEQLLKHLSTATQQHTGSPEFVLFLRKENWDLVPGSVNVKKVLADIPWYGWREQFSFPRIIGREKIDLMHFPHWNIPLFYRGPFVVTIHDLLLLHYPTRAASTLGPISYFFKNSAYRIILWHAIKKSRHIFTPSEFTKHDIIKNFRVKPEKISAVPLAPMPKISSAVPAHEIKSKYQISKPFVLYVGVAYPHKNLEALVEAWKIFCAEHGNDYQLVLAGRKNYFYEKLEQNTTAPQHDNTAARVIFTGFVPDEELSALYSAASLYVFPSLYEGFGLPPLEAMQYGLPVISSGETCLPEILKGAVLYFNPRDPAAISRAIWQGLTDQALRNDLTQKCAQLIHNYSWENTARTTSETYKKVV